MKQVASKDAILRINKDGTWIEEGDLSFEVSESDGYALEEALRVREKLGGEVIVCSMGPQRVKSVIKDALAPLAHIRSRSNNERRHVPMVMIAKIRGSASRKLPRMISWLRS